MSSGSGGGGGKMLRCRSYRDKLGHVVATPPLIKKKKKKQEQGPLSIDICFFFVCELASNCFIINYIIF